MRPLLALLLLGCTACSAVAPTGDPSAPPASGDGVVGPVVADAPTPPRTIPLTRIPPPYDVASTAAAIARWPVLDPGVQAHAVTSFDRTGGNDDGFNGTWSQLGPNDARGEHTILDVAGPGVLRTLWFTSSVSGVSPLALGTIRFYFDGEEDARLAIDATDLFAGKTAPFLAPLVEDNALSTGGFVSWVPLPFRAHLRITTEHRAGFYQAHYETVPCDWDVRSWAAGDGDRALAKAFVASGPSPLALEDVPLDVTKDGAGVIDVLRFEPSGAPTDAELRAARIRAWFDDAAEPQVDVPLAGFFGSALGKAHVASLVWTMTDTRFESRLPMPYWTRAHIAITGLAGTLSLHVAPNTLPAEDTGFLVATFHDEPTPTAGADFVYVDRRGAGKLVATVLGVEPQGPTDKKWWEGDLRSSVDDLRTPSIHGTGHEDDHLGGWSTEWFDAPYTLPLSGLPRADILDRQGQVNAAISAYRFWPGLPFLGRIRHTTEHGDGDHGIAHYSATTFLYAKDAPRITRTDGFDVGDGDAHAYLASWGVETFASAFEGEDATAVERAVHHYSDEVSFVLAIAPDSKGVLLRRLFDQLPPEAGADATGTETPEIARVFVNGIEIEPIFEDTLVSPSRRWAERDLHVPAQALRGSSMAVRMKVVTRLSAARFEAWSLR